MPSVDDRGVLSGIVYGLRNGLQWKDAPKAYDPHKTLYNRFIQWSCLGVFGRIFVPLTEQAWPPSSDYGTGSHAKSAEALLAELPEETEEVIGDRSYDSNRIRLSLVERNITACIPPKEQEIKATLQLASV